MDLSKLCLHTITTKSWPLERALHKFHLQGIGGVSVWRDDIAENSISRTRNLLGKYNIKPVSLVRGGFFTGTNVEEREKAIENNLEAINEASGIGTDLLVLVCGATPGQSLEISREQIRKGIESILPYAEKNGIKLGIEPLHPMYADTRSAICTIKQANEMADLFNYSVGIVVDVYHTWWDPELKDQIVYAGSKNKLFAYHISDWRSPTRDLLNDRTIMGRGVIDIHTISRWVLESGFTGYWEVEIFSNEFWSYDQDKFLSEIINSYVQLIENL